MPLRQGASFLTSQRGGRGTTYAESVLNLDPVAYWRLGESSGTTAVDASGNGHTGTYVNTPTLGVAGALSADADTAVAFTRASSQRVTTAAPVITATDDWTLAAWVNPTASATTRCILYNGGSLNGYGLFLTSAHRLWGFAEGGGAGSLTNSTTGAVLTPGEWAFAVLVRRSGTSYLYLNGELYLTGTTTAPLTPTSMTSAGSENGTAHFMDGSIDEPAIFDRALAENEIARLHERGT